MKIKTEKLIKVVSEETVIADMKYAVMIKVSHGVGMDWSPTWRVLALLDSLNNAEFYLKEFTKNYTDQQRRELFEIRKIIGDVE